MWCCGGVVVWCDRTGLKLLEDHQNGLQRVNGLTEVEVLGPHDIFHILERSFYSRRTAETMMNRQSSRSHAIFTISVDMRCHGLEGQVVRRGCMQLVDLCGSENLKKSGSEGLRKAEASHIGQSLLVLGRVIRAVVQNAPHVPYRDSKLTRMVAPALGGDAYTVLILNVAPGENQAEETLNTLKYAELAQGIKNTPTANVEVRQPMITEPPPLTLLGRDWAWLAG